MTKLLTLAFFLLLLVFCICLSVLTLLCVASAVLSGSPGLILGFGVMALACVSASLWTYETIAVAWRL